jgi:hypothetical protein
MKKLLFLLLVMALGAGVVFAAVSLDDPPGVFALDTLLSENSGYGAVVTSDSVLVMEMPVTADPSSIQAVMALYNKSALQPQSGFMNESIPLAIKEPYIGIAATGFYLRC